MENPVAMPAAKACIVREAPLQSSRDLPRARTSLIAACHGAAGSGQRRKRLVPCRCLLDEFQELFAQIRIYTAPIVHVDNTL